MTILTLTNPSQNLPPDGTIAIAETTDQNQQQNMTTGLTGSRPDNPRDTTIPTTEATNLIQPPMTIATVRYFAVYFLPFKFFFAE